MLTEEEEKQIRKKHKQIKVWCLRCDERSKSKPVDLDELLIYHCKCGNLISVDIKDPIPQPDKDKIIEELKKEKSDLYSRLFKIEELSNKLKEFALKTIEEKLDSFIRSLWK